MDPLLLIAVSKHHGLWLPARHGKEVIGRLEVGAVKEF
jgi:hypothetical protein